MSMQEDVNYLNMRGVDAAMPSGKGLVYVSFFKPGFGKGDDAHMKPEDVPAWNREMVKKGYKVKLMPNDQEAEAALEAACAAFDAA